MSAAGSSPPSRARVVVIGGGIIGCSVAYHLAELGWDDVVVLERDRITSGTTWHAAGLMCTFGSTSQTNTEMRLYTRDLYARLEQETGQATCFRSVGFIELATHPDRLTEYRRISAFQRHLGVEIHEIGAHEVLDRFPLLRGDDLLAGFYVPGDGRVNPVDVTMALARGARQRGVRVMECIEVLDVLQQRGSVTGVRTAFGDIEAEYVVNCAGMWARQLGERSGVAIPLQAAEHYYLITEPVSGLTPDLPVVEDPESYGYYREETGGLMIGLFEPVCAPWQVAGIPSDASFVSLPPDWDRMAPYLRTAMQRVPVSMETGIRTFFCGPESFTPDLSPVVGEAPEVRNYFVAAGLNSVGILSGGGLGRLVAQWIVDGHPDADVTGINIDRFHRYQTTPAYRATRTVESLGKVYARHYPYRSMETARGAKRSPIHHLLEEHGAFFKDVSGWEAADWYAGRGVQPGSAEPTWSRPDYWDRWEREHRAARNNVVLMDMSFMSKFLVQGRDAGRLLNHLSTNDVIGETTSVAYTQWLNQRGTIEADLTVTRLDENRYWVVATDTAHRHVETWFRRNQGEHHASITDVTSGWAQINVQGPRSRELLQSVTSADLSNEAFPFRAARFIDLGFAQVLCIRITYVGELGYELFVPAEQAVHVHERLTEAGAAFSLEHAGLKALSSLRLEKGYRDYGHDIDNTDTPLEVGLGFCADLTKPDGFIGRDAVLAARDCGTPNRRLVSVLLSDPLPMLYHAEVVHRDGVRVGTIRSASYGHSLGAAVGLAMVEATVPVTNEWIAAGSWEIDVAGTLVPAHVSLHPFYDPTAARTRV